MQANTITLSVDKANNAVSTNVDYKRFEEETNRSTYVGPGHSLASRDTMQFYRTLPKRSGKFLGAGKSTVKLTRDLVIKDAEGNDTVVPLIVEINFSVPVGATQAQVLDLRQTAVAALDQDSFMNSLNLNLEI